MYVCVHWGEGKEKENLLLVGTTTIKRFGEKNGSLCYYVAQSLLKWENRYVKSAFLGHLLALFPGTLSKLVYGFNVGRKSAGSLIPGLITTSTMQFVRCYFEY